MDASASDEDTRDLLWSLLLAPTPLVGRDDEVQAARQLLLRDDVRLLSFIGPPGVGKTRLALAIAQDFQNEYANGVGFVNLAPLHDPELIASMIAQALNIRGSGEQPPLDMLIAALRARELLLLLDNFEQILPAAATVADLLAACPRLKILVTSREPLRLRWEHVYPTRPLLVPDLEHLPELNVLAQNPAVTLFVHRAQARQPSFSLTTENAATIAAICVRLDGLPLAIELAATHVEVLPLNALLARLEGHLSLLPAGAADLPARQQTLHAAIHWSYDRLAEEEQALFRRLGVFVGGWTAEAAEVVADTATLGVDAMDGLATLVNKNLVTIVWDIDDELRFGMLETIREFALAELKASGELAAVRQWHVDYFLWLAEQSESALKGPDQVIWLNRLEAEHANLRAALEWTRVTRAVELTARFRALFFFWNRHNHVREGRQWLELAINGCEVLPTALRAKLLRDAGSLATIQNDFDDARIRYEESLRLFRELEDKKGVAGVLNNLGIMAKNQDDLEAASALYDESVALQRELGNTHDLARALNNAGVVWMCAGDPVRARSCYEEALALYREHHDTHGTSLVLSHLAQAVCAQGDYATAQKPFTECLTLLRVLGNRETMAITFEGIADLAIAQSRAEQALRLLSVADSLRDTIGAPRPPVDHAEHERSMALARSQLTEDAATVACAAGRAMTWEQALDEALAYVTEQPVVGEQEARNKLATQPTTTISSNPRPAAVSQPLGGPLTPREREVLELLAEGLSNKQIASRFSLSPLTVGTHLAAIYGKLQVTSRTAAVHAARLYGLL